MKKTVKNLVVLFAIIMAMAVFQSMSVNAEETAQAVEDYEKAGLDYQFAQRDFEQSKVHYEETKAAVEDAQKLYELAQNSKENNPQLYELAEKNLEDAKNNEARALQTMENAQNAMEKQQSTLDNISKKQADANINPQSGTVSSQPTMFTLVIAAIVAFILGAATMFAINRNAGKKK